MSSLGVKGTQPFISTEAGYCSYANVKLGEKVTDEGEDFVQITIQYRLDPEGFGTQEDLNKRYKIEEIMDASLRETGNGDCGGAEIGNGEMFIYCRALHPIQAVETIKYNLKKNSLLEGAVITW